MYNDHNFDIEHRYEYDKYGNIVSDELSAPNFQPSIEPRSIKYEYASDESGYDGRFMTKKTTGIEGLEFVTNYEYDRIKGVLISETDPAGLVTTYTYDAFGKVKEIIYPDNTRSEIDYIWDEGGPYSPEGASFYTFEKKKTSDLSESYEYIYSYFNKFEQKLRTVTLGLNIMPIYTDKTYDEKGRLHWLSEPYFSNSTADVWTVYLYDNRNRIINISTPANSITYQYHGRRSTSINNGTGVSVTKTINAIGNITGVEDPSGLVTYQYYSSGKTKQIDAIGSRYEFQYDPMGHQTMLSDPDAGPTHYIYDPFGELLQQTDAKGNAISLQYDALGRLITKTYISTAEVVGYFYQDDPEEYGYGNIEHMSSQNGIEYHYTYDEINRLNTVEEVIDGIHYNTTYQYNTKNGKLESVTYPSNFSVGYDYENVTGLLKRVTDLTHRTTLWTAYSANARGQLTSYHLGNGPMTERTFDNFGFPTSIVSSGLQWLTYEFDPVTGNLLTRENKLEQLKETFEYDSQLKARLTSWQVDGQTEYLLDYNNNGNVHTKTDVTDPKLSGSYNYGSGAGDHAVTSIVNPTEEYLYSAKPQNIIYTPFNKVKEISEVYPPKSSNSGGNRTFYDLQFTYGPDEQRKKTELYRYPSLLKRKYFIGSNYEEEITTTGVRKLHYISGGDGLFAIYVINREADTMYYIYKDYLGSYETITDENVIVKEHLSFDPWGRRRNPDTWSYESEPISHVFDRGYTGHEHLDIFDLINMNGRVYDPWLGRFLSPDPYVQAPDNSQGFNRYTYAFNNPLKYVDPNGEFGFFIFLGLSAVMGGWFFGMDANGNFNWGDAAKGALITTSIVAGMVGNSMAPFYRL